MCVCVCVCIKSAVLDLHKCYTMIEVKPPAEIDFPVDPPVCERCWVSVYVYQA